jgi:hypothetical protein
MALSHDVADLTAEIAQIRAENDSLHATNAALTAEVDILRVEAVMLRAKTEREVRRSEAMFTILNQVSTGLISGIVRMDAMDKDTRRRQQEDRLGVGDNDPPPIARLEQAPEPVRLAQNASAVEERITPQKPAASRAVITRAPGEPFERPSMRVGDRHLDLTTRAWWEYTIRGWRPTGTYDDKPRAGAINETLADRDTRIPKVDFGESDADRGLRELAENIIKQ